MLFGGWYEAEEWKMSEKGMIGRVEKKSALFHFFLLQAGQSK